MGIDKPLLFNKNYKFDLRVYSLVASADPSILFYHFGKMRVCGVKYDNLRLVDEANAQQIMANDDLLFGHLSNCKVQRSHASYDAMSSSIQGQTMLNDWNAFVEFMYDLSVKKKMFVLEWFERFAHKMETNELTMD